MPIAPESWNFVVVRVFVEIVAEADIGIVVFQGVFNAANAAFKVLAEAFKEIAQPFFGPVLGNCCGRIGFGKLWMPPFMPK